MEERTIEIPLAGVLAIVCVLLLPLVCGLLGWLNSPRVDGHPVPLSRESLQAIRYVQAAVAWEEELSSLDDLLFPDSGEATGAGELYYRSRLANDALERVLRVKRAMETYPVPQAMTGLHALAVSAADAHLNLARAVLEHLANPQAGGNLNTLRKEARNTLALFGEGLDRQQEALGLLSEKGEPEEEP